MGSRLNHMIFFFLLFTTFLNLVNCFCPDHYNRALFIFGDQHLDAGNNNHFDTKAQANFKPYGNTFFNYSSGRFSDGRLISDFIAEYMGLPPIRPYLEGDSTQYVYGANFASSFSSALPETHKNEISVKNLQTQLSYFQNVTKTLKEKIGDDLSKEVISKAIYMFSVGSSDYLAPFIPGEHPPNTTFPYNHQEFVGRVVKNVIDVIKEIYEIGGRNFAFLNVGPLGCYPYIFSLTQSNGCIRDANDLATSHNLALISALEQMQRENDGFKYALHNFYYSIMAIMNRPIANGFKEVKVACCGSEMNNGMMNCGGRGGNWDFNLCEHPSDYLFFDGLDLSEKANEQIAYLFWTNIKGFGLLGPNNLNEQLD